MTGHGELCCVVLVCVYPPITGKRAKSACLSCCDRNDSCPVPNQSRPGQLLTSRNGTSRPGHPRDAQVVDVKIYHMNTGLKVVQGKAPSIKALGSNSERLRQLNAR